MKASNRVSYAAIAGLFAVAIILGSFQVSHASIIQGIGENFVAIEAENYDSLTGTTFLATDRSPTLTTAFGSDVLPANSNASSTGALFTNFSGSTSAAGYDITFNTAGDYFVYVRYSLFENNLNTANYGNEDSFFLGANFNTAAGTSNIETIDLSSQGFSPASGEWEGTFRWVQVTGRNPAGTGPRVDRVYNVMAGDLGLPMTMNIAQRERGVAIDMFVLSTIDNLTDGQLDQFVVVPEPSSALLLSASLGGLAFLRRRRRSL